MDRYGDVSGSDTVLNEKKPTRRVRKRNARAARDKRLGGEE